MNPIKVLIVTGILLFGLILYAVFVPSPTIASECTSYDATVAVIRAQGHHPFFIAPAKLPEIVAAAEAVTEESYGVATRGFMLVGAWAGSRRLPAGSDLSVEREAGCWGMIALWLALGTQEQMSRNKTRK